MYSRKKRRNKKYMFDYILGKKVCVWNWTLSTHTHKQKPQRYRQNLPPKCSPFSISLLLLTRYLCVRPCKSIWLCFVENRFPMNMSIYWNNRQSSMYDLSLCTLFIIIFISMMDFRVIFSFEIQKIKFISFELDFFLDSMCVIFFPCSNVSLEKWWFFFLYFLDYCLYCQCSRAKT